LSIPHLRELVASAFYLSSAKGRRIIFAFPAVMGYNKLSDWQAISFGGRTLCSPYHEKGLARRSRRFLTKNAAFDFVAIDE
jgi:hypothetical protein